MIHIHLLKAHPTGGFAQGTSYPILARNFVSNILTPQSALMIGHRSLMGSINLLLLSMGRGKKRWARN
ncbi:hypothetical protein MPLDJ20_60039 [Mesorhizobium plurifarium]|uniref:Uncharacterized protein n=1 Tax=Mesorhizobium plurifarium TaxID=69974 RepID=A0A090FGF4_MESPL|nr:hypothetical protein MPLDJ20_60039 [Mesorhizobium plurifarium]